MKLFLQITAIAEILFGILLVFFPNFIIALLFETPITETSGIIASMIAGVAVISLTIICWLVQNKIDAIETVKGMLFYNFTIIAVILYLIGVYKISGLGVWLVIGFHTFQGIWSIIILMKNKIPKINN